LINLRRGTGCYARLAWSVLAGCVALCGSLALSGCGQRFFTAEGVVASDGGSLGVWRATPEGCSRDPFDGRVGADSRSVLTFLWDDPRKHNVKIDAKGWTDAPLRLEIARDTARPVAGIVASLVTVNAVGTRLDGRVCQTLQLQTGERRAYYIEGRPTLHGTVTLDCQVKGSHITASVRFDRCDF
jgi:hypothetical protein